MNTATPKKKPATATRSLAVRRAAAQAAVVASAKTGRPVPAAVHPLANSH